MADAEDLKSSGDFSSCGFDSHPGHHLSQDEDLDWAAELECGHQQYVGHNPPWTERHWVTTAEGRQAHIGHELRCLACEQIARSIIPVSSDLSGFSRGTINARLSVAQSFNPGGVACLPISSLFDGRAKVCKTLKRVRHALKQAKRHSRRPA